jgi:6-phosphogluconolactonase
MSVPPRVVVHPDADLLAAAVAARLLTALVDAQSVRGSASVVLTGGTVGIAVLDAVAESPARDAVDWSAVDVWWGDERFLPAGDPERNQTQARAALLDALPLDPARVHPMPASDGPEPDVDRAAAEYATELASALDPDAGFDVLLLGVGPDAHIASLFPGYPGIDEHEPTVVGVHGSPKPPPLRISLTRPTIERAQQIWLVAAGGGKANAVALALSGADARSAPAGSVRGRSATLWLVDRAAATKLPA